MPTLSDLANAIAQNEGYGIQGTIPTVANNPGSLELGNIGYGTIQAAGGNQITVFPSASSGWQALMNQLQAAFNGTSSYYNPSQTLQQFGSIYSNGNQSYGGNLASQLGVSPNTTLQQLKNWWDQNDPFFGNNGYLNPNANIMQNPLNKAVGNAAGGLASGLFADIFSSRFIILIIGVILVAAGLFSFKTTQTIIEHGAGAVKKAGELGAL